MKILIKECKKIMDIRVLLVIAVFTVLFYHLFLEVTIYPAGGQTTDSPYDMPFYAELIESWGTSLPREDWSKLDEKKKRTGRGIHPDHCGGSGSCRCKNYELSGIFEDTGNIF